MQPAFAPTSYLMAFSTLSFHGTPGISSLKESTMADKLAGSNDVGGNCAILLWSSYGAHTDERIASEHGVTAQPQSDSSYAHYAILMTVLFGDCCSCASQEAFCFIFTKSVLDR